MPRPQKESCDRQGRNSLSHLDHRDSTTKGQEALAITWGCLNAGCCANQTVSLSTYICAGGHLSASNTRTSATPQPL